MTAAREETADSSSELHVISNRDNNQDTEYGPNLSNPSAEEVQHLVEPKEEQNNIPTDGLSLASEEFTSGDNNLAQEIAEARLRAESILRAQEDRKRQAQRQEYVDSTTRNASSLPPPHICPPFELVSGNEMNENLKSHALVPPPPPPVVASDPAPAAVIRKRKLGSTGWTEVELDDGKIYFMSKKLKTTVWEAPPEVLEWREEENQKEKAAKMSAEREEEEKIKEEINMMKDILGNQSMAVLFLSFEKALERIEKDLLFHKIRPNFRASSFSVAKQQMMEDKRKQQANTGETLVAEVKKILDDFWTTKMNKIKTEINKVDIRKKSFLDRTPGASESDDPFFLLQLPAASFLKLVEDQEGEGKVIGDRRGEHLRVKTTDSWMKHKVDLVDKEWNAFCMWFSEHVIKLMVKLVAVDFTNRNKWKRKQRDHIDSRRREDRRQEDRRQGDRRKEDKGNDKEMSDLFDNLTELMRIDDNEICEPEHVQRDLLSAREFFGIEDIWFDLSKFLVDSKFSPSSSKWIVQIINSGKINFVLPFNMLWHHFIRWVKLRLKDEPLVDPHSSAEVLSNYFQSIWKSIEEEIQRQNKMKDKVERAKKRIDLKNDQQEERDNMIRQIMVERVKNPFIYFGDEVRLLKNQSDWILEIVKNFQFFTSILGVVADDPRCPSDVVDFLEDVDRPREDRRQEDRKQEDRRQEDRRQEDRRQEYQRKLGKDRVRFKEILKTVLTDWEKMIRLLLRDYFEENAKSLLISGDEAVDALMAAKNLPHKFEILQKIPKFILLNSFSDWRIRFKFADLISAFRKWIESNPNLSIIIFKFVKDRSDSQGQFDKSEKGKRKKINWSLNEVEKSHLLNLIKNDIKEHETYHLLDSFKIQRNEILTNQIDKLITAGQHAAASAEDQVVLHGEESARPSDFIGEDKLMLVKKHQNDNIEDEN